MRTRMRFIHRYVSIHHTWYHWSDVHGKITISKYVKNHFEFFFSNFFFLCSQLMHIYYHLSVNQTTSIGSVFVVCSLCFGVQSFCVWEQIEWRWSCLTFFDFDIADGRRTTHTQKKLLAPTNFSTIIQIFCSHFAEYSVHQMFIKCGFSYRIKEFHMWIHDLNYNKWSSKNKIQYVHCFCMMLTSLNWIFHQAVLEPVCVCSSEVSICVWH